MCSVFWFLLILSLTSIHSSAEETQSYESDSSSEEENYSYQLADYIYSKQKECESIIERVVDKILDEEKEDTLPSPDESYFKCKKSLDKIKTEYIKNVLDSRASYNTDFILGLSSGRIIFLPVPADESLSIEGNQSNFDIQEELCATNKVCLSTSSVKVPYYISEDHPKTPNTKFLRCKALLEELEKKYINAKKLDYAALKKDGGLNVNCAQGAVSFHLPKQKNDNFNFHAVESDKTNSKSETVEDSMDSTRPNNPYKASYEKVIHELKSINEKKLKDQEEDDNFNKIVSSSSESGSEESPELDEVRFSDKSTEIEPNWQKEPDNKNQESPEQDHSEWKDENILSEITKKKMFDIKSDEHTELVDKKSKDKTSEPQSNTNKVLDVKPVRNSESDESKDKIVDSRDGSYKVPYLKFVEHPLTGERESRAEVSKTEFTKHEVPDVNLEEHSKPEEKESKNRERESENTEHQMPQFNADNYLTTVTPISITNSLANKLSNEDILEDGVVAKEPYKQDIPRKENMFSNISRNFKIGEGESDRKQDYDKNIDESENDQTLSNRDIEFKNEETEPKELKHTKTKSSKDEKDKNLKLLTHEVKFVSKIEDGNEVQIETSGRIKKTQHENKFDHLPGLSITNQNGKPRILDQSDEIKFRRYSESLEGNIIMMENDCNELRNFGEQLLQHKMLSSLTNFEDQYNECTRKLNSMKKIYIAKQNLDIMSHKYIFPLTLPSGEQKLILLPTQLLGQDSMDQIGLPKMEPVNVFESGLKDKSIQSEKTYFQNRKSLQMLNDPAFIPNEEFLKSVQQESASSDTSTFSKVANILHMNGAHKD